MIGKLMGLMTIGSTLANITLMQRFLSGIAIIVVLTVISAMMIGLLLVGGFVAIFFALTHFGLDPAAAMVTVAAIIFLITAVMVNLLILRLKSLRELPYQAMQHEIPSISRIQAIVEAFIHGFLDPHSPSK